MDYDEVIANAPKHRAAAETAAEALAAERSAELATAGLDDAVPIQTVWRDENGRWWVNLHLPGGSPPLLVNDEMASGEGG